MEILLSCVIPLYLRMCRGSLQANCSLLPSLDNFNTRSDLQAKSIKNLFATFFIQIWAISEANHFYKQLFP